VSGTCHLIYLFFLSYEARTQTCLGVRHNTYNYTELCDFLELLAVSVCVRVPVSVLHSFSAYYSVSTDTFDQRHV